MTLNSGFAQRISWVPGRSATEKQAALLNEVRAFAGDIPPDTSPAGRGHQCSEVIFVRLEGRRREIKGTDVRASLSDMSLQKLFRNENVESEIGDTEIRLGRRDLFDGGHYRCQRAEYLYQLKHVRHMRRRARASVYSRRSQVYCRLRKRRRFELSARNYCGKLGG